MKRVVLFSTNNCPHCQVAIKYLEQKGVTYRLCNVKTPAGQKEFRKLGLRGVPVLKIGDQVLNGFSVKQFNQLYND